MRILVTGSSGTIGTRLCEKLLEQGHEVIGIDWVENKWQPQVEAITEHLDLRDENALEQTDIPGSIDAVVHLAANARVYELVEHPDRARDNMLTTFNMLEFARTRGIKCFLFASSREAYGNINPVPSSKLQVPSFSEDLVRIEHCESPYTASKVGGEALVHAYTRCYGLEHIIIRFSNVYGMYDDSVRVVPLFIRQARMGEALTVYGEEKCLDLTYIDDAVDAVLLALEKFSATKNDTYNIATGTGTTIVDLAKIVKELLGSSSAIVMGSPRTGEVIRYIADITKAKEKFGYTPQTPFTEGIRKAVDWYVQHEP